MAEETQLTLPGAEEEFVREAFRRFYERVDSSAISPPQPERREFGLGSWVKKIESRHVSFQNAQELKSYLIRNTPFYISYSTAYYEFPDRRPMPKKDWLGADLVFDLDADHLALKCLESGEHEKGWVCEECLRAVKDETIKLVEEFLIPDFGFSPEEVHVNFSGNRGYHVHVRSEEVRPLTGWARREIADYISGNGLNRAALFDEREVPGFPGIKRLEGPRLDAPGWHGRVARRFIQLLEAGKLADTGIPSALARRLAKHAGEVVEGVKRGNWDTVRMTGPEKEALADKVIASAGIDVEGFGGAGGEVDAGVTFDVSKLIRLPGSLHGETGLCAKKLASVSDLSAFDPMRDAVVFGDEPVRVKCGRVPRFAVRGVDYGPFEGNELELPECAAIYLLCKRKARLWRS